MKNRIRCLLKSIADFSNCEFFCGRSLCNCVNSLKGSEYANLVDRRYKLAVYKTLIRCFGDYMSFYLGSMFFLCPLNNDSSFRVK